ncbi:MAG: carboxymuconolactone decarboxylase family protein [Acidovorax sp.]|nr:carboxymuconolactone decarboxylase family protein [Acidovorax sp.]MDZ7866981.1 carboxymuconolactone decarboxylase family protein [Acidovorax sp.]
MSRLNTPATIDAAPAAAQTSLKAVEKQLGLVPNMFRVVANSPAALTGYLQLSAASAQGGLDAATRERIALAVAELNGCGYCLAAHSFLGRKLAKRRRRRNCGQPQRRVQRPEGRRGCALCCRRGPPTRSCQQRPDPRGAQCRLQRRAGAGHPAGSRFEHLHQLRQRSSTDRSRLPIRPTAASCCVIPLTHSKGS